MSDVIATRTIARHFDSPEQEAYLAMWRTYDRLRAFEDELFADWHLTAQQYNLLRLLKSSYPEFVPTLSVIARLVSRSPDITRMLDKLEARGWISRTRSETDRRTVWVGITDPGLAMLDRIAEPLRECHARQLGHLTKSELEMLTALLKRARSPHESEGSPWK